MGILNRKQRVVTFPGTGLETVSRIAMQFGAKFEVVTNLKRAYRVKFDKLILLGGPDIDPRFYGERNRHSYPADRARDAVEWTLIRRALADRKPALGLCRGHQMLAIAAGGALFQDIYQDIRPRLLRHYSPHGIKNIHPDLFLRLPTNKVNSLHHQAIKTPPFGFEVAAVSMDNIVEAIYRPGYLGVQWHPELMVDADPGWLDLFKWFFVDGLY